LSNGVVRTKKKNVELFGYGGGGAQNNERGENTRKKVMYKLNITA